MAHYFFHLQSDHVVVPDRAGREFASVHHAHFHAKKIILAASKRWLCRALWRAPDCRLWPQRGSVWVRISIDPERRSHVPGFCHAHDIRLLIYAALTRISSTNISGIKRP